MKKRPLRVLTAVSLLTVSAALAETEPNDTKAQANLVTLPSTTTPGVITGNSQAPSAYDYFRVTTAAQGAPGFYRHRLTIQSAIPDGLVASIRGLAQLNGVITAGSDADMQISGSVPGDRYVQFYTAETAADIYVRVRGISTTTADYFLDYDVSPVAEITGPTINGGGRTITTVGLTSVNTDIWVFDAARVPIAGYGNDDESVAGGGTGTTPQSLLTRSYGVGTFHVAISRNNLATSLPSPVDDNARNGNVLDFPGAVVTQDDAGTPADLDMSIDGALVPLLSVPRRDVTFVTFSVATPVELVRFTVE